MPPLLNLSLISYHNDSSVFERDKTNKDPYVLVPTRVVIAVLGILLIFNSAQNSCELSYHLYEFKSSR